MNAELSVVIVPLSGGANLRQCLQAVTDQGELKPIEVIVPHDDRISDVPALQQAFPQIKFLKVRRDPTYAESRSAGLQAASAEIVALTEDQCIPDPDWCCEMVRSHSVSQDAAIGGAVEKGFRTAENVDRVVSWSIYFCDYMRYANPIAESAVATLTDCNVSYKRNLLQDVLPVWQNAFHENVVHATLLQKGRSLRISPRIVVRQQRNLRFLESLRERFAFGSLFGSTRVASASIAKRALYALLVPGLPFLLTFRIATSVFGKRKHRLQFVKCLPAVFVLNFFWSLGEFSGYLKRSNNGSLLPQHVSA